MKKWILSLLVVSCLCFQFSQVTFANEFSSSELPKDAIVLYEDNSCVLYQSKENSSIVTDVSLRAPVDYESIWLNSSSIGSFPIYNHRSGSTGVTWKVESSSPHSYASIYMTNPLGLTVLNVKTIKPSSGDVYFRLANGVEGTYTVHYTGFPY